MVRERRKLSDWPKCSACGDPPTVEQSGRLWCTDCFMEVYFGVVNTEPAMLYSGGGEHHPYDGNPSQQNAIRIMEDH